MELKSIVPWGRSLAEYQSMFCLSEQDLTCAILGCGDGPASFNAQLTQMGGNVVSVDPTYAFSQADFELRISQVYDEIMAQMALTQHQYIWQSIRSLEALGEVRMSAMQQFLADFERGKADGRYITASLPTLPFLDQQFDLALCSHFLFLYSEQVDCHAHIASMRELTRVAKEVRVYPLVTLKGEPSHYLEPVIKALSEDGVKCERRQTAYQFQKGAVDMLVARSA